MSGNPGGPTLIASVRRALRLLEAVAAHQAGATAKQLARETSLPLATTYHLLRTLVHEGYLRKLDDGGFVLGDAVEALQARGSAQALFARVRPALAALRDELSMAAYLSLYEDGEIRVVEIVDGPRAPRVDMWVGFEDAGHATALGKCVLRQLDQQERADYLARHPLLDLTPHTATEEGELLRRLRHCDPLAFDREEYQLGTGCAAVLVSDGRWLGALGVSYRADRAPQVRAATGRLRATAGRIARTLALTI